MKESTLQSMKKNFLLPLFAIITMVVIAFIHNYLTKNQLVKMDVLYIIPLLILGLFIFSNVVRRIAWFKPYFISKYNFLTSKFREQQELDFSKDILFEKLLEVLQMSGFKIIQADKTTGDILATTSISWVSWGENIYISLDESKNKTIMDFYSVCFFQVYSWGKNERNYHKFIQEFEKSLVV